MVMRRFKEALLRMVRDPLGAHHPCLDWIQVEVTTRCNAACVYCPQRRFLREWKSRDMSMDTFRRLLPAFQNARFVHLQGWGEPLLNPDLFHMIREAKQKGCQVGTTTNAVLWTDEISDLMVELGVDLVAFSLAGTDETQDLVRCGTRVRDVREAIRSLNHAKQRHGADRPSIHLAYMVLRSGLEDATRLPDFLDGLGVDEVVMSTLDFVPSEELESETLIPQKHHEYENIRSVFAQAAEEGKKRGLSLHFRLQAPGKKRSTCTENVLNALVVSATGDVCPCVFAGLPLRTQRDKNVEVQEARKRLCFGNVNAQFLMEIWQSAAYKEFRHAHERGQPPLLCAGCPKLFLE
jgi:MoaA/NifB/PqqE/SkfB family radical SAM enzyme